MNFPRFTATEKRRAIEREVTWRKRVYPNRVLTGRMSPHASHYQITIMEEIADDYKRLEEAERFVL